MENFGKQIARIRKIRGLSQSALARALGLKPQAVQKWEAGGGVNADRLQEIAAVLGCSPDDLLGTSLNGGVDSDASGADYGAVPNQGSPAPLRAWEHQSDIPPGEYIYIPRMDIQPAATESSKPSLRLSVKSAQAFPAERLRQKNIRSEFLAWTAVSDNSMAPRICAGDHLVIDTSQATATDGGVFALWYAGAQHIRRTFLRPGGGMIVRSDSSAQHPDMLLTADEAAHVTVLGRVVLITGDGGL